MFLRTDKTSYFTHWTKNVSVVEKSDVVLATEVKSHTEKYCWCTDAKLVLIQIKYTLSIQKTFFMILDKINYTTFSCFVNNCHGTLNCLTKPTVIISTCCRLEWNGLYQNSSGRLLTVHIVVCHLLDFTTDRDCISILS